MSKKMNTVILRFEDETLNKRLDLIRINQFYGMGKNELLLSIIGEWVENKESERVDF